MSKKKEVAKTNIKTCKSLKKTLNFEKSGEAFSIEIILENVSPQVDFDTICVYLKTIFEQILRELNFNNSCL